MAKKPIKKPSSKSLKYIPRKMQKGIKQPASSFPIVTILGPRQTGKTTIAKHVFSKHIYLNLEDLNLREFAKKDPVYFLEQYKGKKIILDEVQNVPELLSQIQVIVDEKPIANQFVLTGSQNLSMSEKISQSLAGRTVTFTLLPLSIEEIKKEKSNLKYEETLFKGGYPRIYAQNIEPTLWYPEYILTYIERDVRNFQNIVDLSLFQQFLRLCAGRVGQVLNIAELAKDCGINVQTAKKWLSILEASYIIFFLRPYYKNFNKRLIKSPKLYFYDTGLASSLLNIKSKEEVATHYLRGPLFESMIISEVMKKRFNEKLLFDLYFWQSTQHEIDLIITTASKIYPIEIKSAKTVNDSFFDGLKYWYKLNGSTSLNGMIIYGGDGIQKRSAGKILAWDQMDQLFKKIS